MKSKTLLILVLLFAVAILASSLINRNADHGDVATSGQLLAPGLDEALNDVMMLKMTFNTGDSGVTFEKSDSGWTISEKFNYAADSGKIRRFLIRLGEARILEQKTSNPEFYGRLGVADVGSEEGSGTLAEVSGANPSLEIIVGNVETRAGNGTYVRRKGETGSYLIDSEIVPPRQVMDWLDKQILDISSKSVEDILITHNDGETIHLERIADWMIVRGLPADRELTSPTASESMSTVVSSLSLEDVMPANEFDGGDPDAIAVYEIADGRVVSLAAWKNDAGHFFTIDLTISPEREVSTEPVADEKDEENPAEEEATERADPVEVARTASRIGSWVFKVPAAKYDLVVKRLEDMLKPLEKEEDS